MKIKVHISAELPFRVVTEGPWHVSRCEMLGISSQGKTEKSAYRNLRGAILLFFQECLEMGTLDNVLKESGFSGMSIGASSVWVSSDPKYATQEFRQIEIKGIVLVSKKPSMKPASPTIKSLQTELPFWVEAESYAPATAA